MAHLVRDRLARRVRPLVTITEPPGEGVLVERDVAVPMRDGVVLRVDVFRPAADEPVAVLLCAHPYGKDNTPPRRRHGYGIPRQYRVLTQSEPISHSAWTSWEAPDPAHWVARGYAVINADLRGWGHSGGEGELFSEQEGRDGHDLVEWAAVQPWSTGRVGMTGVSYLAISQWAVAAERPPHLAAICPWEGFTDAYRDLARPGGVREDGFVIMWTTMLRLASGKPVTFRDEQKHRPLRDAWWEARARDIEKIDVPALVCGSFSDHNLHSRGSFEGFRRISSEHKWLYTHRGPKWATYYSPEALAVQAQFFDHFLRDEDTGIRERPRVRVEVRDDADTVASVHQVADWPPPGTTWRELHLDPGLRTLADAPAAELSEVSWRTRGDGLSFCRQVETDAELVGPMSARLWVSLPRGGDVSLFLGVTKERDGREVGFEGSYGFRGDMVTHGMLRASHRRLDPTLSEPGRPVHTHTEEEPLEPGEIVPVEIALLPSATLFRAGDVLRLDLRGLWLQARNPLTGHFPAGYRPSARGTCVLHTGGEHDSTLTIPLAPWR
ncbi:CocE/NonD family hydrolase [Actinomycetospora endophytica]|uniref:CocE/NonD family hydrolase n=1 Tax=Actinomycetospora endophytica TaxID=2291215 RepID=A0ABS8P106_9PSEU|nr:CocE/NonD family hydrolase [Actinomycetospora endophytica]MCD2191927.1 CocE/NonD family hydrolase [Actinomycetospora endophytica]